MTPSMAAFITMPFELNKIVSFSKISTKISFVFVFLASSFWMGFWIAVEATVLDLKILGRQPVFLA